jgi:hypothetical protein
VENLFHFSDLDPIPEKRCGEIVKLLVNEKLPSVLPPKGGISGGK